MREQGQYPVVFITLKNLKTNTWEECYNSLCDLMLDLYDAHQELADSVVLTDAEKRYYQSIVDQTADRTDYANALKKSLSSCINITQQSLFC